MVNSRRRVLRGRWADDLREGGLWKTDGRTTRQGAEATVVEEVKEGRRGAMEQGVQKINEGLQGTGTTGEDDGGFETMQRGGGTGAREEGVERNERYDMFRERDLERESNHFSRPRRRCHTRVLHRRRRGSWAGVIPADHAGPLYICIAATRMAGAVPQPSARGETAGVQDRPSACRPRKPERRRDPDIVYILMTMTMFVLFFVEDTRI